MYEKLDKLRAEVERNKKRIEDDKAKLRISEQKLKEAEESQILADVGAMRLTPEQVAEFLKLATSGKLGSAGTARGYKAPSEINANDEGESEENEDEDN